MQEYANFFMFSLKIFAYMKKMQYLCAFFMSILFQGLLDTLNKINKHLTN